MQEIRNDRLEALNEVETIETKKIKALQLYGFNEENEENYTQANANTASGNNLQVYMVQTIKSLKRDLEELKKNNSSSEPATSTDN